MSAPPASRRARTARLLAVALALALAPHAAARAAGADAAPATPPSSRFT